MVNAPQRMSGIAPVTIVTRAALGAIGDVLSPPLRRVLWRSLGLTLLLLVAVGTGLAALIEWLSQQSTWLGSYPFIGTAAVVLASLGVFLGLIFLIPPISAVVAGFYLDDVAEVVEKRCDPAGQPGTALPTGQAIVSGLRFGALSLGVNFVALLLLLVPGVNLIAFLGANAYLFGREYFELAAGRYQSIEDARMLRAAHNGTALMGGLVTAFLVTIPLLNLITPLFGAAMMVRIHNAIRTSTNASLIETIKA
ncbi:sulfate transporter family protein [Pseudochelatococcus sp. G4_1912]|uniref:sulfate transporter family protein n=1 Tax=Pseudochelatococcus sp. G4_1912 TaxID=3114288 RepID=UPI0039C61FA5